MLASPQTICTRALKLINAIGQGDTPSADDISDAFETLKEMIDAWSADRLAILVVELSDFNLVSGQATYSLGPGGDFNRARPVTLWEASVLSSAATPEPLELALSVLTVGEWQRIPVKNVQGGLPTVMYYDHAFDANGRGNVTFYPVPNVSGLQARLYCPTPIEQFSSLTAEYNFPPAYLRALRFNLAMDLAPEYDIVPTPNVAMKAAEYLGDIRAVNNEPVVISVDSMLVRTGDRFNYYTGEPY